MGEIQTPRKPLRRIAVAALGWTLVMGGVAGLLLPFVPGWLLMVLGALVLNTEHPRLRRALDKLRGRFPALTPVLHRIFARRERCRRSVRINDLGDAQSRVEL